MYLMTQALRTKLEFASVPGGSRGKERDGCPETAVRLDSAGSLVHDTEVRRRERRRLRAVSWARWAFADLQTSPLFTPLGVTALRLLCGTCLSLHVVAAWVLRL